MMLDAHEYRNPIEMVLLAREFHKGTGRWPARWEIEQIDMTLRDDVLRFELETDWAYEHDDVVRKLRLQNKKD